MNKKAIAILGAIFLLIVGTLGFLIVSRSSSKTAETPPADQGDNGGLTPDNQTPPDQNPPATSTDSNPPVDQNPTASSTALVRLTQETVISPTLFFDGSGVAYFTPDGQLYNANFETVDGKLQLTRKRTLGVEPKAGIRRILWPQRGNSYIAEFDAGGRKQYSTFYEKTGSYVDLPSQVRSVDWLPGGDRIFYVWSRTTGHDGLVTADPDAKNYQAVSDIWEKDANVTVSPDGLNVLFYRDNNFGTTNSIGLTTPDAKVWRTLIKNGYNYGVLWAPDSKRFLFGQREPSTQKLQLSYFDLLTGETKNLGLFTSVEKAFWAPDSQTVFAAVPVTGTAGEAGLTVDTIYEVNAITGAKREHSLPQDTPVDARELFLAKDGTKLFFKNAQDGALYYLDLTQGQPSV